MLFETLVMRPKKQTHNERIHTHIKHIVSLDKCIRLKTKQTNDIVKESHYQRAQTHFEKDEEEEEEEKEWEKSKMWKMKSKQPSGVEFMCFLIPTKECKRIFIFPRRVRAFGQNLCISQLWMFVSNR